MTLFTVEQMACSLEFLTHTFNKRRSAEILLLKESAKALRQMQAENEANTRLIAAKRDLLEALKFIAANNPHSVSADVARAAIVKATGGGQC